MLYKIFFAASFVVLLMSSNVVYCGNFPSTTTAPTVLSDSDSEEILPWQLEAIKQANDNGLTKLNSKIENDDVSCHVLNVGEGNCVFLRGQLGTVVIDAGIHINGKIYIATLIETGNELYIKYSEIINYYFKNITTVSFVITHIDIDHYAYIPFLAKLALGNGVQCLNFFIGCTNIKELNNFSEYLAKFEITACQCCNIFYHITPNRDNLSSLFNWYDACNDCRISIRDVERILHCTIGEGSLANFYILEPINGLLHNDASNAQSIVILFEYSGSNILFTGDATGDTLDAIFGNVTNVTNENEVLDDIIENFYEGNLQEDTENLKIIRSAISKRNRNLLKCVNLLMEPHHGSSNDGCNLWLTNIIKLSGDNFVGVISSANSLGDDTYGHRSHNLTYIDFPQSAKSLVLKQVFSKTAYMPGNAKDRFIMKQILSSENIFQTSLSNVYHFSFNKSGMSVNFINNLNVIDLPLTEEFGLSIYSKNFWNLLLSPKEEAFIELRGAITANSEILSSKCIQGPRFILKFNSLNDEDKKIFVTNVCNFCNKLQLTTLQVFGRLNKIPLEHTCYNLDTYLIENENGIYNFYDSIIRTFGRQDFTEACVIEWINAMDEAQKTTIRKKFIDILNNDNSIKELIFKLYENIFQNGDIQEKSNVIMCIINILISNNILDSYVVIDTLLSIVSEYETLTPNEGINRLYTIAAIAYQLRLSQASCDQ